MLEIIRVGWYAGIEPSLTVLKNEDRRNTFCVVSDEVTGVTYHTGLQFLDGPDYNIPVAQRYFPHFIILELTLCRPVRCTLFTHVIILYVQGKYGQSDDGW